MNSRRSALKLGLTATLAAPAIIRARAQTSDQTAPHPPAPPAAQPAAPKPPILPLSEALLYATVHLEFAVPGGTRTGTGFLFGFFNSGGKSFLAVVSNQHVFLDSDTGSFRITKATHDQKPDTGNTLTIEMTDLKKSLIRHPQVDLAIYPVGAQINALVNSGQQPFFSPMDEALIPDEKTIKDLPAIQQIISIGYPGQLWDNVNYVPLFHRGYTASPAGLDFQGRKEFAIDIATWPGASGSPILVYDEGTIYKEKTNSVEFGRRVMLLGVAYGVATQEVDGQVVFVQAPNRPALSPYVSASQVPTNLGLCIKASRILEFEPLLAKLGVPVPAGYKMRAAG